MHCICLSSELWAKNKGENTIPYLSALQMAPTVKHTTINHISAQIDNPAQNKNKTLTQFLHSVYSYATSLVKYGNVKDVVIWSPSSPEQLCVWQHACGMNSNQNDGYLPTGRAEDTTMEEWIHKNTNTQTYKTKEKTKRNKTKNIYKLKVRMNDVLGQTYFRRKANMAEWIQESWPTGKI